MWKQGKQWETLFLGAPKSLQKVTAAMKLKDTCSLEEKLWPTSVQFSCSVVSDSLRPHGLQHARPPCPSLKSQSLLKLMSIELVMPSNHLILCHRLLLPPSIFPRSESFPMRQFFASGSQSIGASASSSVLPVNIQGWFPLGLTGLISLQSKGSSAQIRIAKSR